jgi:alkylated DNA repair protein (DNA oxidative demethylase)
VLLTADLFESVASPRPSRETMAEGAVLLRGFARTFEADLIADIGVIVAQAPFRHMVTPGGHSMSVAMTNSGGAGWVTDRSGYRYDVNDPDMGKPWPAMPPSFRALAGEAAAEAGFAKFSPDARRAHGCRCTRTGTSTISKHQSFRFHWACRRSSCSAD